METNFRTTPDGLTALQGALSRERSALFNMRAAFEHAVGSQMALEQQLTEAHETITRMERDFSIMQVQLNSARKKILRLSQLREEAEARSLRHQFIDIYNLEGFKYAYHRFARELSRGTWNTGTIVYFDLDGFKLVNDLLSHDVGNEILIAFGRCLVEESRPEDVAACLHGDEFALILPNAEQKDAEAVMARMHKAAARIDAGDLNYEHIFASLGREQFVAFSSGYFTLQKGDHALTPEEALQKAESMVPKFYDKRTSRNR